MALKQMAHWIFPTVYFVLSFGQLVLAQPSWQESDMTVKQGETVVVHCRVDLGGDPFGVVRIIQKLDEANNGINEVPIAENGDLKAAFDVSDRYQITDSGLESDGTFVIELTFDGIRGEDGGKLGCLSIDDDQNVAYITINVQVPVQDVYIVKIDDENDVRASEGVTIHLRENEPLGVGCVVKMDGSLTVPKVELLVDGNDETNRFQNKDSSARIKSVDGGPDIFTAEARYTYITAKPTSDFNQKNLTCQATAEGYLPRSASAFLDVQYAPVITCAKYENYAKLAESVTLECELRANPGATLTWLYGLDEESATEIDPSDPDLGLMTQEKPFDEDKTKISLTVQNTEEKHFTTYWIRAENTLGTTSAFLKLIKGAEVITPPPTRPPSPGGGESPQSGSSKDSGNSTPPSIAACSLTLLLCYLCHLLHH